MSGMMLEKQIIWGRCTISLSSGLIRGLRRTSVNG